MRRRSTWRAERLLEDIVFVTRRWRRVFVDHKGEARRLRGQEGRRGMPEYPSCCHRCAVPEGV